MMTPHKLPKHKRNGSIEIEIHTDGRLILEQFNDDDMLNEICLTSKQLEALKEILK
tara:strand:+ start:1584 stop:1751 length:168 start_codon:yes stop_codon:yes gene_type:complete